ncbi:MAG: hypothetical protein JSW47_15275, partial [Phycisphaerales bacterium]
YGAVGIGRHAHVLQWGYFDSPSEMTEAGRKLFLNCICYIHRFDRVRPLVRRVVSHRLNAIRLALLIDRIKDKSFFSSTFTPELMEKFKGNAKGLADCYRQNLEFVYRARGYQVDSELKELCLESNRTVKTLGRLIEMLDDPQRAEKATRLLRRYTSPHENLTNSEQWRQWFAENKDRIFFSDTGGYKFFVTPEGYPVGQKNQTAIGRTLFR